MSVLSNRVVFNDEWDDIQKDPLFEKEISKRVGVIVKDGRILEGCRYEFDTNRWMYGLYQIPNTQIVKWFYMDEEDKKERTPEECVTPLEVGSVRRVQVKKGDTREVHHFRVLEELKA